MEHERESDNQHLLQYLTQNAILHQEFSFKKMLQSMPAHIDVKDQSSLEDVIRSFMQSRQLAGSISTSGITLTHSPLLAPPSESEELSSHTQIYEKQDYQTQTVRNATIPVLILRDILVEGNKYKYLLKIQNNKSQAITYVRIYIYYPENGLNLQDSNPQTISTITARQILEITFHFLITDPILEGTIQAVVMYLDEAQELQTVSVSPQLVENLSGNLNPIEMDPKSFAQVPAGKSIIYFKYRSFCDRSNATNGVYQNSTRIRNDEDSCSECLTIARI